MFKKISKQLKQYSEDLYLRARLLVILLCASIPVLIFYLSYNCIIENILFIVQNVLVILLVAAGLFALVKHRYETAINLLFLTVLPIVQFSFLAMNLTIGTPDTIFEFAFSTLHLSITMMLVGAFAYRRYQLIVITSMNFGLLLIHAFLIVRISEISMSAIAGVFLYFIIALAFSFFIFSLVQQFAGSIKQKEKINNQLKELDSAKDAFLANVSHEMRNPLNAIVGLTGILKKTDLNREQREYVESINRCNSHLTRLISNLLDLNKIQQGMYSIKTIPFSLRDLIFETAGIFHATIEQQGLELQLDLPDQDSLDIESDPTALSQILINLLDNAIKYTERGFIRIILETEEISSGKRNLTLSVQDSGIGMNDETQQHIFSRFYQADQQYTKKFVGSGIGLSLVLELVTQLEGTIEVNSSPGTGSTFVIRIAVEPAEESILPKSKESGDEGTNTGPRGSVSALIGIAEDDAINRLYLSAFLTREGFRVITAENGKEACALIDEKDPDLFLIDIQMPVMDGFQCAAYIRSHPRENKRRIPLIATTGYSFERELEKIKESGFDNVLIKPIAESQLLELIRRQTEGIQTGP